MEEYGLNLKAIDIIVCYPRGKIGVERPTLNRAICLFVEQLLTEISRVLCGNASLKCADAMARSHL